MVGIHPVARFVADCKHWQLFAVFALYALIIAAMFQNYLVTSRVDASSVRLVIALTIPFAVGVYLWVWCIGHISNACCEHRLRRGNRLFNLAFPIPLVYLVFSMEAWPRLVQSGRTSGALSVIMFLHFICVFLVFYGLAQSAMRLRTAESGDHAGFWRSIGAMLLIWYFPIGVWFIQPRLQALIRKAS